MVTDNAISVLGADEAVLLPVMGAEMTVSFHAIGEFELVSDQLRWKEAVEIHPFTAVLRPGLATERLLEPLRLQCTLKCHEMLAGHCSCRLTPQFSGRALRGPARRVCTMKWRTCAAPATPYHGPLQLLVRRLPRCHCGISVCTSR